MNKLRVHAVKLRQHCLRFFFLHLPESFKKNCVTVCLSYTDPLQKFNNENFATASNTSSKKKKKKSVIKTSTLDNNRSTQEVFDECKYNASSKF